MGNVLCQSTIGKILGGALYLLIGVAVGYGVSALQGNEIQESSQNGYYFNVALCVFWAFMGWFLANAEYTPGRRQALALLVGLWMSILTALAFHAMPFEPWAVTMHSWAVLVALPTVLILLRQLAHWLRGHRTVHA